MAEQKVDIEALIKGDESEEIDIRGIFEFLHRYRRTITLITLLFTLIASVYAYLSPSVYQSQTLIKIPAEKYKGSLDDFMTLALGQEGSNIEDELIVLETHNIVQKALGSLNIGTRYYAISKFKQIELYKDSPFLVIENESNPKAYGLTFRLEPVDDRSFRLKIEQPWNESIKDFFLDFIPFVEPGGTNVYYDKIHSYNSLIETPWFSFTIQKIKEFRYQCYSFTITPNDSMSGFIRSRLSASGYVKKGNIISLTYNDNVPLRAMEVLDAVAKAYLEETSNIKSEGSKKKLYNIDLQLETVSGMLENSSKLLQEYKISNTIANLSTETNTMIQKLSEIEKENYKVKVRIDTLNEALSFIRENKNVSAIAIEGVGSEDSSYQFLINQIQQSAAEYKALSVDNRPNHPKAVAARVKLDSLKRSLENMIKTSLVSLKKQKESLDGVIESYRATLQNIPRKEQKLEQLKRNFMINENIYSYLLKKKAETVISESSAVSGTRILENASLPASSIKPNRKGIILKGLLLGFLVGIVMAVIMSLFDNRIKTIYDLEKLTKLAIYGTIPHQGSTGDTSVYDEAMRTLWTNIEFASHTKRSKLIVFTSSLPGEGKSMSVSRLGEIIAQSNKSVVIVDFDMRRASLHEIFKLPNKSGTSALLSRIDDIEGVLQDTHVEKLKVITAGARPPNPTALIMSDHTEELLNQLKKRFDYVLLDTPPAGLVSDAKKLMHMADLSLIVVRMEHSSKDFFKKIDRSVRPMQEKTGIVVNDMQIKSGRKYNDYYY